MWKSGDDFTHETVNEQVSGGGRIKSTHTQIQQFIGIQLADSRAVSRFHFICVMGVNLMPVFRQRRWTALLLG